MGTGAPVRRVASRRLTSSPHARLQHSHCESYDTDMDDDYYSIESILAENQVWTKAFLVSTYAHVALESSVYFQSGHPGHGAS